MTTNEKIVNFFKDRFPLEKFFILDLLAHKEVPVHKLTFGYYTGGLTLLFFMIQVVTGIILLFYYEPTISDANLSVEYLANFIKGGFFIHNLHTWSSSLMIFFGITHFLMTFAMKSFEKPREFTWITGLLLLGITFTLGFTGYLLPWNQIAVNATKVGLQSVQSVGQLLPGPLAQIPKTIVSTFQGGDEVGQPTLSRFYVLHIAFLPLAVLILISVHLLLVQLHGMSQGVDKPSLKVEKFFPEFILKDLMAWTLVVGGVLVLALCLPFEAFLPYPLLEPFNALGPTPGGIKPEWYFYFVYYPLELLPFPVLVVLSMIIIGILVLSPWIFRKTSRKILTIIAAIMASYLFIVTVFGQQIYSYLKP